jgi:predicted esterase
MKVSIKYQHTAQYHISHVIHRGEEEIVIALHGYGQLAEFFLKKLHPIFSDKRLILVPEATNYSYLEGFSGRVGANWMTKHEREAAIENNNQYLNTLLENILIKYSKTPRIKVLGFSQGAATASRWVSQIPVKLDTLILWGGGFAHDIKIESAGDALRETKTFVVLGRQDEFVTVESIKKQEELIEKMKLNVEKHYYDGGHDLNLSVLTGLLDI